MHTIDVPGIEHVYGFQRNPLMSGYKPRDAQPGDPLLRGEEPGLGELLR
jgi:hypothetical protein